MLCILYCYSQGTKVMNVVAEKTQDLETLIQQAKAAQATYATFTQAQVDRIFKQAAQAANEARIPLAKLAVAETGMGIVEDKVIKNHFASEFIYNKYKNEQTCGILEDDPAFGYQKIAEPIGILAGIVPVTNPTSTTIFKALLALKTRNAIIFSPHPKAKQCSIAAAKIILEAAIAAGAPPGLIGWIEEPTIDRSQALMQHPDIKLIIATGGPNMVKAAYSSGHPSLGVGAGNTPAVIDETANIKMAVSSILLSKTFDNGMICASEQSIVIVDSVYEAVKQEFIDRGAYFLDAPERDRLRGCVLENGHLNAKIVGQSVERLAELADLHFEQNFPKVLMAEVQDVGTQEPLSYEKLSPILAVYRSSTFEEAVLTAEAIVEFGGLGHTSVLYTSDPNHIRRFEETLRTSRVLINTPASQGAIGDLYNFRLDPSLTLGCGSWGGNTVSENVAPHHLLNVKTVSQRRENMLWFRVPPKVYFRDGCLPVALRELTGKHRAFVVTDKPLFDLGVSEKVTKVLESLGITHQTFYDVEPDPSLETVQKGLAQINLFQPDVILAIGGGSPMDAAKVMWLMYEQPDTEFEGLATRFMDIRKRVYEVQPLGQKALMVCIPTTSGTGSEVTPFAVVTDQHTGIKYPLADYALTPNVAIVDPDLVMQMPKRLTAYGGVDALTHAIEAYVSVFASEFTNGMALESIRLLMKYLPAAYHDGVSNPKAREKVHYASTMAGMAFANAFLGICHSLAHKLGSMFHVPHGLANALMISHVIRYNATDMPFKQAIFPQYKYPNAKWRYAQIADYIGLSGATDDGKIDRLIDAIESLKAQLDIPKTIKEACSIDDRTFYSEVESMAEQAFDDQCTGANPRYPLIADLKSLYIQAYEGVCADVLVKEKV
ncbi:bifunctional acetaldehyde-CoA/alcohol dehydrogenase [Leptolyngbya sp. AN03gr2]|uniref:bifunctional acetaldehyde-CoA/alcohol dehydrogenase n=1 Tax=unclassified Leptolyngbya TaxID=2650499 RepID=UPI003D314427